MLEDVVDVFEADEDGLAGGEGLASAGAAEGHGGGVVFEIVVADFGDVDVPFEVEEGDFEEEGKGLDPSDDGGVDASGIGGEVGAGEAELFEEGDGAFGAEGNALFF